RDLSSLVYSGLYKLNGAGKLEPDLATTMPEVTSDGLSYSVTIRDDARWQDGVPVTADDVVFTVEAAQNPDYGAPLNVRGAFSGIDVKAVSDHVVIFTLRNVYAQFPGNLTLGILPKHLWEDIKPINFPLSELNLKPVGSGPYEFKSLTKDSDTGAVVTYRLQANQSFYGGRPHLDELDFKFYGSEDDMIAAFNANQIDDLSFISGTNIGKLRFPGRVQVERLKMPSYFAAFFNQTQSPALSDKNVRLALSYATDRVSIINAALGGNGFLINSPMLGGILDINPNVKSYDYDPDQARAVLQASGWTPDTDGVLKHGKDRLEIRITTSDWSELATVADMLKTQWEAVGARVTVETLPITSLQQSINDRSYQVLLFGVVMTTDPDPFPIWDSSQREGQGRNFALYSNKEADKLLEDARTTLDPVARAQKYDTFQDILIEDIPAVFLYSPHYLYGLDYRVKGFDATLIGTPSDRFANVVDWYLNTKRQFK
ncbi:MAG TPA: ABC transporter substrate-binding protein, partial [Candidatus Paceibacterota bacterium]|nr:ABC transporter substrate-binding protein [Candidatus Paceibacterota bacterium]